VTATSRGDQYRLRDIVKAIDQVEVFTSIGRKSFFESTLHQRAVEKNLEIIGESAKHVSAGLKTSHPEVEWRALVHLGDSPVHEYFHTDPEELWRIATKALPPLKERLRKVRG
jgi:uncharacterized protein with HEPN domain